MLRTPSIRSQDDPLSVALRPPPTESAADRQVRLQQEAEARRISEQIDEELRIEREKLKKSKSDVKVICILSLYLRGTDIMFSKLLLLGQAESGKSTLQKQFQLMYSPASLESERMSWRTVVYFNVVRSIKKILVTLEAWDDIDDGSDSHSTLERQELSQDSPILVGTSRTSFVGLHAGTLSSDAEPPSPTASSPTKYSAISGLRRRLLPLVNTEPELADRLSGGISVSGSGKGEVYVRSGWQARTIHAGQKLIGRRSKRNETEDAEPVERPGTALSIDANSDVLVDDVATMLNQSREDITALWEHSVVRALISKRKLKLDEWSEL